LVFGQGYSVTRESKRIMSNEQIKQMPQQATGTTGFILDTIDGYVFRVYHKAGDFTDYKLLSSDLEVKIVDEDAFFYPNDKGEGTLDYGPDTLGISDFLK
jgi:hypothetical protein